MKAQVRSLFSKHGSRKANKHDHATTSTTRSRATPKERFSPQLPSELWAHIFTFATGSITPSSWDGTEDEDEAYIDLSPRPDPEEPKLGRRRRRREADDDFGFLESSSPYGRDSAAGSRGFLAPRPAPPDMATKMSLSLTSRRFNSIASQHLFHTIYISHKEQARLLARRLESQDPQDNIGVHIRVIRIAPVPSTRAPPPGFDPELYSSGGQTPAQGGYDTPIPSVFDRVDARDIRTILCYAPNLEVFEDHAGVRYSLFDAAGQCTPDAVLDILASRQLTRLAWTTYAHPMPLAPALVKMSTTLRWLELQCLENEDADEFGTPEQDVSAMNGGMEADAVCLAELQTLKLTLSNPTLMLLAAWRLPKLRNLSILASDFAYAGQGFGAFFESHGSCIRQLELGHSSATIEEYWLSRGLEAGAPGGILRGREGLLAAWCPNLKEFICSADAEWNWHDPDRIRPHTLLKSHPTLLFIGVRDIEKRLRDDLELARARRRGRQGHNAHSYADQTGNDGEVVFFRLLEQMQSLLRRSDFPAVKFVRDMGCGIFSPPAAPSIPEEDLEAGFAAMKQQVDTRKRRATKLLSATATSPRLPPIQRPQPLRTLEHPTSAISRRPSLSGVKPKISRPSASQQIEALTLAASCVSSSARAPLLVHDRRTPLSPALSASFNGLPPDEPVISQPAYYMASASRTPHAVFIHPSGPDDEKCAGDVKGKGRRLSLPSMRSRRRREPSPIRFAEQRSHRVADRDDDSASFRRDESPVRFGDDSSFSVMREEPAPSFISGVTVTIERKQVVEQTLRKSLETIQQKRYEVVPWEVEEEKSREQDYAMRVERLEVVPWERYDSGRVDAGSAHVVIEHEYVDDEWDSRGRPRWRRHASASAVALRGSSCSSLDGSIRKVSTSRARSQSSSATQRAESPMAFNRPATPTGPWPCESHLDLYGQDGTARYGDSFIKAVSDNVSAPRMPSPDLWNTRTGSPIHFAANEDDVATDAVCESETETTDSGMDADLSSALSDVDLDEMNTDDYSDQASYSTVAEWVLAAQKRSYGDVNVYEDEQASGDEAGASFLERTLSFRRGSASSDHMQHCKKAAAKVAQRLHHAASFNVASASRPKTADGVSSAHALHPSKSSSILPSTSSIAAGSSAVASAVTFKDVKKPKRKTRGFHNPFVSLTHGIRMNVVREQVTENVPASSLSSTWEVVDTPARVWTVLEPDDVAGPSRSSHVDVLGGCHHRDDIDRDLESDDNLVIEPPRLTALAASLHPLIGQRLPSANVYTIKQATSHVKTCPTSSTCDPQGFYQPPTVEQSPNPYTTLSKADQNRIFTFYRALFQRCRENGVWLEGREGVNVTVANMRRVRAGLGQ
ncbi:hypothetical protein BD626DRAFT_577445 [Schizophyllum amplum]|uniref:Uncharacterized protein n=1 Tax=Schizophyllum amplum TaxID=97359 RepID=A0A550BSI2_9AGAR|nr:hypothetical protein BD626DRAFT_577445 [Auriculariopsis ampla]